MLLVDPAFHTVHNTLQVLSNPFHLFPSTYEHAKCFLKLALYLFLRKVGDVIVMLCYDVETRPMSW